MYDALKLKNDEPKGVASKVLMKCMGNDVQGQAVRKLAALVSDDNE
jgi:hypothetical protein